MHFLFFLLDYSCYILFAHRKLSVRCPLWILPLFHYIVAHFGGLLLFTLDFALSIIKILTLFFFFPFVSTRSSLLSTGFLPVASEGHPLAVEHGLSSRGVPA